MSVPQKLDISSNFLHSLLDEMSGLQKLKKLRLKVNNFAAPPVSVLSRLTALTKIDMGIQMWAQDPSATFRIPSSLLPILHPGLVHMDLRQQNYEYSTGHARRIPWDDLSLSHLGRVRAHVADRRPVPTLLF